VQLFIKHTNILGVCIELVQLLIGTDKLVKLTSFKISGFEIRIFWTFLARHNLMIEKNSIIWNSY